MPEKMAALSHQRMSEVTSSLGLSLLTNVKFTFVLQAFIGTISDFKPVMGK